MTSRGNLNKYLGAHTYARVSGYPTGLRLALADKTLSKILERLHAMRSEALKSAQSHEMTREERQKLQAEVDEIKKEIDSLAIVLSATSGIEAARAERGMEERMGAIDEAIGCLAKRLLDADQGDEIGETLGNPLDRGAVSWLKNWEARKN